MRTGAAKPVAEQAATDAERPQSRSAGRLDLAPIADMLGLALRLAQLRAFEAFYSALEDLDLRPGEMIALFLIDKNPGVRQGVLATVLSIKRSNMVKLVAGLQARGLLERQAAAGDKRAVELTLTAAGRSFAATALPRFRAHERNLTQGTLTQAERADLIGLLEKLYAPRATSGARSP